jgi:adenylate cyclase
MKPLLPVETFITDAMLASGVGRRFSGEKSELVVLDSQTILTSGYPLRRNTWASIIDTLATAKAKVIVLDVVFGPPTSPEQVEETEQLIESVRKAGTVVLPALEAQSWTPEPNEWPTRKLLLTSARVDELAEEPQTPPGVYLESSIPELLHAAKRIGVSSEIVENDGVLRKVRLVISDHPGRELPSLALAAYLLAFDNKASTEYAGDGGVRALVLSKNGQRIMLDLSDFQDGRTWIVPQEIEDKPSQQHSISEVLSLDPTHARNLFQGKVVFVGATAQGVASNQPVPGIPLRSPIHNQRDVFELLVNRHLLHRGTVGIVFEILLTLIAVFCSFRTAKHRSPALRILGAAFSLILPVLFMVLAFQSFDFVLRSAGILLCGMGVWLVWVLEGFSLTERARAHIRQAFSSYLDPSVVSRIVENPDALHEQGEIKSISVMFTDLRNFTGVCEGRDPQTVVADLNQYFSLAAKTILEHQGTLDKYIGDAVMAFWGAPLESPHRMERSLDAAFQLLTQFDRLKESWQQNNSTLAKTDLGIGIHDGDALVGNIGGELRFNYTAIGDNVNLASRLEALCKKYKVRLIVSGSVTSSKHNLRFLDKITVAGKSNAIEIYTAFEPNKMAPGNDYCAAFSHYLKGSFSEAKSMFADLERAYPTDTSVILLRERCCALESCFLADWKGVWTWEK